MRGEDEGTKVRRVKDLVRIHYTRDGNRYVEEWILRELRKWELVP